MLPIRPSPPALSLVRGGAVSLVVGSLASFWYFLSSQSPSSPFYPGTLPQPVKRFAWWALASGVVLPLAALFMEVASASEVRKRRIALVLVVATICKLIGLFIGGLLGVYGVQVIDPLPSSVVVMSLRTVGDAAILYGLVALARDLFRKVPSPSAFAGLAADGGEKRPDQGGATNDARPRP